MRLMSLTLSATSLHSLAMQIVGGVHRMQQVLSIASPHIVLSMNDSGVICALAWAISTLNHQHSSFLTQGGKARGIRW